jgi:hypothetical protein
MMAKSNFMKEYLTLHLLLAKYIFVEPFADKKYYSIIFFNYKTISIIQKYQFFGYKSNYP